MGAMIIKVDLHKAYDSLDLGYLEATLKVFGFPEKLVRFIMFTLKESTISVLWNGEKLPAFKPKHGLSQGNPLAPYLFILAMERLS